MGGEGATPYEVLLHAALVGETTRFTRQDGVEQTWRIMQPLLDAPPPVHVYAPGSWGPTDSRQARCGARSLAGALDRVVSSDAQGPDATPHRAPLRRRRSRRSPTTRSSPTATPERSWRRTERSTGSASRVSTRRACSGACSIAGRARSGSAPSRSTIRRRASTSRARTCWRRRGRRRAGGSSSATALTMGPRDHEDEITPHTRPPADDDADHLLVRTVECLEGEVEVELICEPVFDYGREAGDVDARRRRPARGGRDGSRTDDPSPDGPRARNRGRSCAGTARPPTQATRRTAPCRGRRGSCARGRRRRGGPTRRLCAFWRSWLGRARIPDHRWRDPSNARRSRSRD